MSYPQPNSNAPALGSLDFFRLFTPLASPGDIYESQQGMRGLAMGPDSTLQNIVCLFYDPAVTDFMNEVSISPERVFIASVAARNDLTYQPSGRPGRLLFYTSDLYDPNYKPVGHIAADTYTRITPQMDVIQYFANPPSVAPARNDKTFYFQGPPQTINSSLQTDWIIVPLYGRKWWQVELTNLTGATNPAELEVRGVQFAITDDSAAPAAILHQETQLLASTPVASGAQEIKTWTSNADGSFDVLVVGIRIDPTGATDQNALPLKIFVSDRAQ